MGSSKFLYLSGNTRLDVDIHFVKCVIKCLWLDLFQYLSTSPEQEPKDFERNVRAALIQIRDFPDPLNSVFKDGKPRAYRKEESGLWSRIS